MACVVGNVFKFLGRHPAVCADGDAAVDAVAALLVLAVAVAVDDVGMVFVGRSLYFRELLPFREHLFVFADETFHQDVVHERDVTEYVVPLVERAVLAECLVKPVFFPFGGSLRTDAGHELFQRGAVVGKPAQFVDAVAFGGEALGAGILAGFRVEVVACSVPYVGTGLVAVGVAQVLRHVVVPGVLMFCMPVPAVGTNSLVGQT